MTISTQDNTHDKDRVLKYVCYAIALVGFLIPLLASKFIGMSASKMPAVTVATAVLWVTALIIGYFAFLKSKKAPPTGSALWLKLSSFVGAYSSLLLTQMILTGYLFYPTIEKTFVAKYNAYWLMFSLFVMGLAINVQDWKRIARSPKVVGFSALIRWVLMPVASFAVAYLVFIMLIPGPTGKALAVGIIILGCAPTGTTSNALTMIAKGDLALSVSVTTVNTLIAPFLLPVLMHSLPAAWPR